MRLIKLLGGIVGALLTGSYFYQRSNEMMRAESKSIHTDIKR